MKRVLLLLALVLGVMSAKAQCTPDPLYADSLFGVWPDTLTNMVDGVVGETYFQQLDMVVPSNAGQVPGFDLPPFTIDSGSVVNVIGLPPGLSYACNSQTAAACTFIGGQQGCAAVTGTPTEEGVYPITIELNAYLLGFAYPLSFDGYRIEVTDGSVSLTEEERKPRLGQNSPNPFTKETFIPFRLAASEVVDFKVMDMLGQEVFSIKIDAEFGMNSYRFSPEGLESGIYLYSIESSAGTITRRMVYDRP